MLGVLHIWHPIWYIVHLFMYIVEFECYVVDTVHDVNNNRNRKLCYSWNELLEWQNNYVVCLVNVMLWMLTHPQKWATYGNTGGSVGIWTSTRQPWIGRYKKLCVFIVLRFWFYWMFYDHFSARSLLAKLGLLYYGYSWYSIYKVQILWSLYLCNGQGVSVEHKNNTDDF